ncbi:host attachment protein [Patescibacteria group bacterium]
MQLPQSFYSFDEPMLIAVTDSTQARLFLADGRTVEEIETITADHLPLGDQERYHTQTPSGTVTKEQTENLKEISREELYTALSENLRHRYQKNEFTKLAFAVPKEHLNELKETIHIDLLKITQVFIPKLLTREDPLEIVARTQEET